MSIATVRELAIVELFSQKEKNINSTSLPSSPTTANATSSTAFPHPRSLQDPTSSPYQQHQSFGLNGDSPKAPRTNRLESTDFLAPPRSGSLSSNHGGGSVANLAAAAGRQTASPGLWGRPDPVDELLLSYHRSKGDSVGDATNALQNQLHQNGGSTSGRTAGGGQGSSTTPTDSAWSAKAIGMGDHKFNQPFSQSPHSLASPLSRPTQTIAGMPFQPSSFSLSNAGGFPSSSNLTGLNVDPASSPSTSTHLLASSQGQSVFGGGLGGTSFDTDFTSPWTHGVQAFSGAVGVGGSTESPEGGDNGFGDLLGDAKEIAFLVSFPPLPSSRNLLC